MNKEHVITYTKDKDLVLVDCSCGKLATVVTDEKFIPSIVDRHNRLFVEVK